MTVERNRSGTDGTRRARDTRPAPADGRTGAVSPIGVGTWSA
ncbi:hypothetical protein [Halosimplex rubrum]|nr:hypothetical protein [Halosimplex rubrum]